MSEENTNLGAAIGDVEAILNNLDFVWQGTKDGKTRVHLADAVSLLERARGKLRKAREAARKAGEDQ